MSAMCHLDAVFGLHYVQIVAETSFPLSELAMDLLGPGSDSPLSPEDDASHVNIANQSVPNLTSMHPRRCHQSPQQYFVMAASHHPM
jgi:hypothetical protein